MSQNLVSSTAIQTGASAQGDVTGRDKNSITVEIENYHQAPAKPRGVVDMLLLKLEEEQISNTQIQQTIDSLARYLKRRSHDGIDGLEAKLKAGGRESEHFEALEKKEEFSKLLAKWSLYESAQRIFVHLLARVEHEFNSTIQPQVDALGIVKTNDIVTAKIVDPIVSECGSTVFAINHATAMGMVYWLAEQCYVRWHK